MANPRKSMLGKRNRVFNGPPTPPWLLPVPEKKTGLGKGKKIINDCAVSYIRCPFQVSLFPNLVDGHVPHRGSMG